MKYGFIIDNRKCIGCHACTTACKSEHEVPLGVFRTWVKQVEKGTFPNTRRVFSVHRCNHCSDAPCVEICPVESLFIRADGIVDFDNRRCIGCKSCMQACPYDALYIDPNSQTAAKCNYCAHRVDIGLEPACVVVCPEHAIISGDMDDPDSEISQLLAREQTVVRKPEKSTVPNLFYIEGDAYSLVPTAVERPDGSLWSAQSRGVGHFAKYTERMAWDGNDLVNELLKKSGATTTDADNMEVLGGTNAKRAYGIPEKGILWGWEVPAYVTTKAIASGAYLFALAGAILGLGGFSWFNAMVIGTVAALVFLVATTAFLVMDLDQPRRFVYVLLRPQWRSWLVRGGYALTIFGGLLTLMLVAFYLYDSPFWSGLLQWLAYAAGLVAVIVSIYTAFLFAQARGRDFWQSPLLPLHMLVHSAMAGAALFLIVPNTYTGVADSAVLVLGISILANLTILAAELTITHPTSDAKATVRMITQGRYKQLFLYGVLFAGNLVPLVGLLLSGMPYVVHLMAGLLVIAGIYLTERIWVEAPQRIPLT